MQGVVGLEAVNGAAWSCGLLTFRCAECRACGLRSNRWTQRELHCCCDPPVSRRSLPPAGPPTPLIGTRSAPTRLVSTPHRAATATMYCIQKRPARSAKAIGTSSTAKQLAAKQACTAVLHPCLACMWGLEAREGKAEIAGHCLRHMAAAVAYSAGGHHPSCMHITATSWQ